MMATAETGVPSPSSLPLFFRKLVPVAAETHGAAHLDRGSGFLYAGGATALPLGLGEFGMAAMDYPIVFAPEVAHGALAVTGIREAENLFVDGEGKWRKGTYVPAYVRAYPFILIDVTGSDRLVLGVDPEAQCLARNKGVALFEGNQPSAMLNETLQLCAALRDQLRRTIDFCTALDQAGLLVPNQAVINFTTGGRAQLQGFRVIDAAKFDALADSVILEWRKRGWLMAIYAHFLSMQRWARIVDFGAERL
ncbi:MAG TPA: SapC family protein, partial [Stellaceae bacterium]|nr:SapC family protein [Stellaceae bacterium]